jgi:hypothetical protein
VTGIQKFVVHNKTGDMKKKKKEKLIRQGLPLRVWEDEIENNPNEVKKVPEEEERQEFNYSPYSEDDIEGE